MLLQLGEHQGGTLKKLVGTHLGLSVWLILRESGVLFQDAEDVLQDLILDHAASVGVHELLMNQAGEFSVSAKCFDQLSRKIVEIHLLRLGGKNLSDSARRYAVVGRCHD